MHKLSSYARTSLASREKENTSLPSNTNSFKDPAFPNKISKPNAEETPFLLDITEKFANLPRNLNKSRIEIAENQPKASKSQEFVEKKFQNTTTLFPGGNAKRENFARNAEKPQEIERKAQKLTEIARNPSENASFFPQMLENLNLSGNDARKSLNSREISFTEAENAKLAKFYAKEIVEELIIRDKRVPTCNFLETHKIPSNLRSRMIDWMIEVLFSYKCQEQTFFLSVSIMDNFLKFSPNAQSLDEIHLIGVTSMFIASKFEEIYPFKLKLVHEKIAHRKISVSALKLKEHEILQTLDFSLLSPTCHEFVGLSVEFLDDRAQIKQKTKKYLKKVCVYLLKMTLHDYEITAKYHAHVLAAACIFVSFKIIENLDAEFRSELMAKEIKKIFPVDDEVLFEAATKILYLAKNFEKLYANLENLRKFNGFSLKEDKKP